MSAQTVLIVEDEENILEAIKYNLEHEGYRVLAAQDGEEGLNLTRQDSPDLVLLDIMLPRLDGFELCRILRRESDVPILMLTAKGEEIDRVVGLELGADDYVTKPFSMRELVVRVRNLLRRSRSATVREAQSAPQQRAERERAGGGRRRPHREAGRPDAPDEATGVQPSGAVDSEHRQGVHAGADPGAAVGIRLHWRRPDGGRARPVAAGEDRGRAKQAAENRDH